MKLFLALNLMLSLTEARKSYLIKEKIASGEIKVHSPRVLGVVNEWCWFKDPNNQFCIQGNEDWKTSINNKNSYQQATVNNEAPHFKHHVSFNSTQSMLWASTFSLARAFYTKMSF